MTEQELAQARLEKAREIGAKVWAPEYRAVVLDGIYDEAPSVKAALDALTEANWQPPVDPDLLIARESVAQIWDEIDSPNIAANFRAGKHDGWSEVVSALAAIKLFKARQS